MAKSQIPEKPPVGLIHSLIIVTNGGWNGGSLPDNIDSFSSGLENLLRTVLETAGAQVTTLQDAAAALEQLPTLVPDALVVDLGMPNMDGYEFINRVRASSNLEICDIPAAALTALARSEDRTKALQSGFEIHLAKPIDPGELAASVGTLVRRRRH